MCQERVHFFRIETSQGIEQFQATPAKQDLDTSWVFFFEMWDG